MKKLNFEIIEFGTCLITAISVIFPFILVNFLGTTVERCLIDSHADSLGDGVIIIVVCCFGAIFLLFSKHIPIIIAGIINLVIFFIEYDHLNKIYNAGENELSNVIAKSIVMKGAGFYLLLIGSILMILSGFYALYKSKNESEIIEPLDKSNDYISNRCQINTKQISINDNEYLKNINYSTNNNKESVVVTSLENEKIATLLKRVKIFIEDEDFESAKIYCERILDMDPENGECYKYKLFIENGAKNITELKQIVLNGKNINTKLLDRAIKYGATELTIFKYLDYKSDLLSKINQETMHSFSLNVKDVLSINETDSEKIKENIDRLIIEKIYENNSTVPYTVPKIYNLYLIKDYKDVKDILDSWYDDIKRIPNVDDKGNHFKLKRLLILSFENFKDVENDLKKLETEENEYNKIKDKELNAIKKHRQEQLKKKVPFLIAACALVVIIVIIIAYSINANKVKFEEVGLGGKKYKLKDGSYATGWHELKGNQYYFDSEGWLKTNTWVDDKYYVGENGIKQKNNWINYNNNMYYLGEDGEYYSDGLYTIGDNQYSFAKNGVLNKDIVVIDSNNDSLKIADKNGLILKNAQKYTINDKEYYIKTSGNLAKNEWLNDKYFGDDGARVINGFAIDKEYILATSSNSIKWNYINETGDIVKKEWVDCSKIPPNYEKKWCFADEHGILLQNQWFTYQGNDYYFDDDCYMLTNDFVDGIYYVDNEGKKLINVERNIKGINYQFDANGKVNRKIEKRTNNEKWKIDTYTDSNKKYVTNKNYFITEWTIDYDDESWKVNSQLIIDDSKARIRIKDISSKDFIHGYNDVKISIWIENSLSINLIDMETIGRIDNQYLVLSKSQQDILLRYLKIDGSIIHIMIIDYLTKDKNEYSKYNFVIDSTGFNEIYLNL